MNPLADFLAWLTRRKAARALRDAERQRNAIMRQIAYRRDKHRAFRPKQGELLQATCRSLAASAGRVWGH